MSSRPGRALVVEDRGFVRLADGSWATGFGCEAVAAEEAKDITRFGGWRDAVAAGAL